MGWMAQVAQAYFHFHADLPARDLKKFVRQIDRAARPVTLNGIQDAVLNARLNAAKLQIRQRQR